MFEIIEIQFKTRKKIKLIATPCAKIFSAKEIF